ncbi:MAG TPA: hypothetical protein PK961_05700 [bacterium]|nr:hypothetical protein [bacterium]
MKRGRVVALLLAVFALGVLVYAWQIEPRRLTITHLALPAPLAEALAGARVVYVADLHVTPRWPIRKRFLATLRALDPDYLLLGGDLVWYEGNVDASVELLKQLPARRGAYAVLGDADYQGKIRNCAFCHVPGKRELRTDLPVTFLRNEALTIADGAVELVGLDADKRHEWKSTGERHLPADKPSLVLTHYPEALRVIAPRGADLVLGADTHGGQFLAPRFLFRWVFNSDRARYLYGWFDDGGTRLFVTRGVGESILPLRLGRPPEIVLLEGGR